MDPRAFHIANLLVGNKKTEGALEMTFIGPTLTFTSDNIIAVTGGDLTPMLDGQPFPMYKAVLVKKGQKLMFAGARNGSRGYIAFAGGLDIPLVMGSKSTLLRNHIGGVEGRKLEKGDNTTVEVLEKICLKLGCGIDDIMEILPDSPDNGTGQGVE